MVRLTHVGAENGARKATRRLGPSQGETLMWSLWYVSLWQPTTVSARLNSSQNVCTAHAERGHGGSWLTGMALQDT